MKSKWKPLVGVLILLAALFAANCGTDNNDVNLPKSKSADHGTAQQGNSPQQAKEAENSKITLAVRQELDKDESVSPAKIEVETADGIVSLRGEVPSQQVADRAQQLAQGVAGVRSVHSFLKVAGDEQS